MRLNTKKRRDWCDTCSGYTYHGFGVGCLVCTGVEPVEPSGPVHVTIKNSTWFNGQHIELEITHEEDGAPARVDGLLVPKGRLLHTIHSFRPCFVYVCRTTGVRGNTYFLRGES